VTLCWERDMSLRLTFSSLFIDSCSKSSALSISSFLSLSRLCTKDSSSWTIQRAERERERERERGKVSIDQREADLREIILKSFVVKRSSARTLNSPLHLKYCRTHPATLSAQQGHVPDAAPC
jgi:hypothetical protein